jgi:hypothetical protein
MTVGLFVEFHAGEIYFLYLSFTVFYCEEDRADAL